MHLQVFAVRHNRALHAERGSCTATGVQLGVELYDTRIIEHRRVIATKPGHHDGCETSNATNTVQ